MNVLQNRTCSLVSSRLVYANSVSVVLPDLVQLHLERIQRFSTRLVGYIQLYVSPWA